MTSQLDNNLCCIKHCWRICEQISNVTIVHVNDWTTELAIIISNDIKSDQTKRNPFSENKQG